MASQKDLLTYGTPCFAAKARTSLRDRVTFLHSPCPELNAFKLSTTIGRLDVFDTNGPISAVKLKARRWLTKWIVTHGRLSFRFPIHTSSFPGTFRQTQQRRGVALGRLPEVVPREAREEVVLDLELEAPVEPVQAGGARDVEGPAQLAAEPGVVGGAAQVHGEALRGAGGEGSRPCLGERVQHNNNSASNWRYPRKQLIAWFKAVPTSPNQSEPDGAAGIPHLVAEADLDVQEAGHKAGEYAVRDAGGPRGEGGEQGREPGPEPRQTRPLPLLHAGAAQGGVSEQVPGMCF